MSRDYSLGIDYGDYKNQTFLEMLLNTNTSLPDMCPELSQACKKESNPWKGEFSRSLGIEPMPDSYCDELCVKLSEYDLAPNAVYEELVDNNYKNWADQSWAINNTLVRHIIISNYIGALDDSFIVGLCSNEQTEEKISNCIIKEVANNIFIDVFGGTNCGELPNRLVNNFNDLYRR